MVLSSQHQRLQRTMIGEKAQSALMLFLQQVPWQIETKRFPHTAARRSVPKGTFGCH